MTGDFRGDGNHPDGCQGHVRLDFGQQCGVSEVRLCAEFSRIDVGPFQMNAQNPGAAGRALFAELTDLLQHPSDFLAGGGHGGGQERRGAEAHMGAGDGFEGGCAFHQVLAAAAMHMQVDKTR